MSNLISFGDKIFGIHLDLDDMQKNLYSFEREQFPFACSMAINRTLKITRNIVKSQMETRLDRPVPFTLNSLYIQASTKKSLYGEIGFKYKSDGGTPASRYLYPQAYGGGRKQTPTEKLLTRRGIIGSNERIVMAKRAAKNQYGNIPAKKYTQVLSALQAHTEAGFTANSKRGSKNYKRFFAGKPRGGDRARAIYERTNGSIKPLWFIENNVKYQQRFNILNIVEKQWNINFKQIFDNSMKLALKTAKGK